MKFIASVSFGKDSLAMLLRLLEEKWPLDAVIFYNTGMEFNSIYRIKDRAKELLLKEGVEFVELVPPEPFLYSMFERPVKFKNKDGFHYGYGWCGGPCRWGTRDKIREIKKYKASLHDDVIDYVGIAADEPHRFEKAKAEGKRLPLVEWGMTEADCLSYCHERGWFWYEDTPNGEIELYTILDRVSCWCCANKNKKELKNIYTYLPTYWDSLKDLQSRIEMPFKKYQRNGVQYGDIYSLEELFKKGTE